MNSYVSHGIVAFAASLVGGVCSNGLIPGPSVSAQTMPAPANTVSPSVAPYVSTTVAQPVAPASGDGRIAARRTAELSGPAGLVEKRVALPMTPDASVTSREAFNLDVPNGWPVVVVRAVEEENVWYIQEECQRSSGSIFSCSAVIGNANTPVGTRFELAAIVANNVEESKQFVPGATLRELPKELPATTVVSVFRQ